MSATTQPGDQLAEDHSGPASSQGKARRVKSVGTAVVGVDASGSTLITFWSDEGQDADATRFTFTSRAFRPAAYSKYELKPLTYYPNPYLDPCLPAFHTRYEVEIPTFLGQPGTPTRSSGQEWTLHIVSVEEGKDVKHERRTFDAPFEVDWDDEARETGVIQLPTIPGEIEGHSTYRKLSRTGAVGYVMQDTSAAEESFTWAPPIDDMTGKELSGRAWLTFGRNHDYGDGIGSATFEGWLKTVNPRRLC